MRAAVVFEHEHDCQGPLARMIVTSASAIGCAGETIASWGHTVIRRPWSGARITVYNRLPTIAGTTSCVTEWKEVGKQCSLTACVPFYGPVTWHTTPTRKQRLISYAYLRMAKVLPMERCVASIGCRCDV